jgi:hypothetical protein
MPRTYFVQHRDDVRHYTVKIKISSKSTVNDLKQAVNKHMNINPIDQELFYGNIGYLKNEMRLCKDYQLPNGTTIIVQNTKHYYGLSPDVNFARK